MSFVDDVQAHVQLEDYPLYPKFEKATLRLELSNICNHQCIFCPNHKYTRKRIEMSEELAVKCIKEAARLRIKEFAPFLNGEPFISKKLARYIQLSKELGIPYVYITTNGALATPERMIEVMDAGVDSVKFSINAGTRVGYSKVHGKDDFDAVIKNIKFAGEYKKKSGKRCKILTSFVVTRLTKNETDIFYNTVKDYVDDIAFFSCEDRAGAMPENKEMKVGLEEIGFPKMESLIRIPCTALFNEIVISCEGYMVACCEDGFNNLIVANVNDSGIKDGWYSEQMVNLRKRHLSGDIDGILCHNCFYKKNDEFKPLNEQLRLKAEKNI